MNFDNKGGFPGPNLRKEQATMKRKMLFRAMCGEERLFFYSFHIKSARLPVNVFEDVMHQLLRNERLEDFVFHETLE